MRSYQYEYLVSILKTELGVEPARKTIELYEQIPPIN